MRDEDPPGRPLLFDTSREGSAATVRVDSGVPHLRGADVGEAKERSISEGCEGAKVFTTDYINCFDFGSFIHSFHHFN